MAVIDWTQATNTELREIKIALRSMTFVKVTKTQTNILDAIQGEERRRFIKGSLERGTKK